MFEQERDHIVSALWRPDGDQTGTSVLPDSALFDGPLVMIHFSTALRTCLSLGFCCSLFLACGDEDDDGTWVGNGDGDGEGGEKGGDGDGDGIRLGDPCQSDKECRVVDGLCDPDRNVCVECLTENDCGTNEACLSGICTAYTSCKSSRDCPLDEVCDTTLERCVDCVGNNDCAEDQACVLNRCETKCTSDKDCRNEDKVCSLTSGTCQDCVSPADCEDDEICSPEGLCLAGNPGGTGGSGNGSGGGDGSGGGNGSGGGGNPDCNPELKILLQRSGLMFELPNAEGNWWSAVAGALDKSESDLLDKYASTIDMTLTTFHQISLTASCELLSHSASPLAPNGLSSFLATEANAHAAYVEQKVDAPVPNAITATIGSFGVSTDKYILLVTTGSPDSCADNDDPCIGEPVIQAIQNARASGITTKILYLGSGMAGYPQGMANAGAGLGVLDWGLDEACFMMDYDIYSESGGSAPFEQPLAVDGVAGALDTLLADIATCQ